MNWIPGVFLGISLEFFSPKIVSEYHLGVPRGSSSEILWEFIPVISPLVYPGIPPGVPYGRIPPKVSLIFSPRILNFNYSSRDLLQMFLQKFLQKVSP